MNTATDSLVDETAKTSGGRMIGQSASDLVAFHGKDPIAQATVTPTYVARTSNVGGTADGAFEDEGVLATGGGNTYSDAAANAVIGKLKNNIAELKVIVLQLAADNAALRTALSNKGLIA